MTKNDLIHRLEAEIYDNQQYEDVGTRTIQKQLLKSGLLGSVKIGILELFQKTKSILPDISYLEFKVLLAYRFLHWPEREKLEAAGILEELTEHRQHIEGMLRQAAPKMRHRGNIALTLVRLLPDHDLKAQDGP